MNVHVKKSTNVRQTQGLPLLPDHYEDNDKDIKITIQKIMIKDKRKKKSSYILKLSKKVRLRPSNEIVRLLKRSYRKDKRE